MNLRGKLVEPVTNCLLQVILNKALPTNRVLKNYIKEEKSFSTELYYFHFDVNFHRKQLYFQFF